MIKRNKERAIGISVVVVLLGLLGTQKLFARPSYEMSLAAGLLCPSVAAIVSALELSRKKLQPLAMLARGVENAALIAMAAYVVAFLHGIIGGFCDLWRGTMLFILGPAIGTVLGGVWGACASEIARRRRRRRLAGVLAGLVGPLGSLLFKVSWFYATPVIFAFEPFVGYFSGALWDTTLVEGGLRVYRAATAATLFAIYIATLHLERHDDGTIRPRALGRPGLLVLGALALSISFASVVYGSELGHWQTSSSIARELGGHVEHGRCHVVYDARLPRGHVERFAADCEQQIVSLETWLDMAPTSEPVTVFLFRDRNQKRVMMGAGRTSVAKPWRREIYLQNEAYPHPVVRHELMHVLAPGRGPFHIAGAWGGLLPNPGLIEGIAEASSPRDDNLSGDEWAAAMRRLELLPRARSLLSLAFFSNHSSTSYIAAGSLVTFVRSTHGPRVVAQWYGGRDIAALSGQSLTQIEQAWWQHLDAIELRPAALAQARARFDRPSLFRRSCPHIVDETLSFANGRVGSGDIAGAHQAYDEVLRLDPGNWAAKLGIARCQERARQHDAYLASLTALSADERMTEAVRLRALEQLADNYLRRAIVPHAREIYARVLDGTTGEGRLRTLDVKMHYADDDIARRSFVALLIGSDIHGPNNVEALDHIGAWRAASPDDGTPDYLLARQHLSAGKYELVLSRLDAALRKRIPVPRVALEIHRMRAIAACAGGEHTLAEQAMADYAAHPLASDNRHAWYSGMVQRCTAY